MRIVGLYFSGTGNTWYTMDKFMELSRKSNHQCTMYSVECRTKTKEEIAKEILFSDVLVIGYPSHASEMPRILKNYLISLSEIIIQDKSSCKSVFSLSTMGWFSGDGSMAPERYVKKMGMKVKWAHNLVMPFNMGVPKLKFGPPSKGKINAKLAGIEDILSNILKKIECDTKYLQGNGPVGKFFGWGQRTFSTELMHKFNIEIDKEKCKKCGICVNACPTAYLSLDEKLSNSYCTHCLRCFNLCKHHAIKVYGSNTDPTKHKRYDGPVEGKNYLLEYRGK